MFVTNGSERCTFPLKWGRQAKVALAIERHHGGRAIFGAKRSRGDCVQILQPSGIDQTRGWYKRYCGLAAMSGIRHNINAIANGSQIK